jgi:hydrogenase expression/formation protein HypE
MTTKRIALDHGSGGEASHELVKEIILSRLDNPFLRPLDDSAVFPLPLGGCALAMTTDCYVVTPIFFPGGNIGSLSVHGTVNDLSMQGAHPLYLTLGLILEEGLLFEDLIKIIDSVAEASHEAKVSIVAGDTKVVPKGQIDKIFITTSGIGLIPNGVNVSSRNARPGDMLIVNGNIADHGMAVLSVREGLQFRSPILSDSAPLNSLVSCVLDSSKKIHVLRDPTRGGVAAALNEIALHSGVSIQLFEETLPIGKSTSAACEILGLDPLYVANEGKCLVILPKEECGTVLNSMKKDDYGKASRVIGEVKAENPGKVLLKTRIGGTRILSMPTGEQLPRIC